MYECGTKCGEYRQVKEEKDLMCANEDVEVRIGLRLRPRYREERTGIYLAKLL